MVFYLLPRHDGAGVECFGQLSCVVSEGQLETYNPAHVLSILRPVLTAISPSFRRSRSLNQVDFCENRPFLQPKSTITQLHTWAELHLCNSLCLGEQTQTQQEHPSPSTVSGAGKAPGISLLRNSMESVSLSFKSETPPLPPASCTPGTVVV